MANEGRLYALLVGVNQCEQDEWRPLDYARADVFDMRRFLKKRTRLAHCILLASPATQADGPATSTAVLNALDTFRRHPMTPEDTFLLHFAGHGIAPDGDHYLVTADAMASRLERTALLLADLLADVRDIPAGQVVAFLDCCRNDPRTGERGEANAREGMAAMARTIEEHEQNPAQDKGLAVLSACWDRKVSYEYPEGKHSWFCYNLLDYLHAFPDPALPLARLNVDLTTVMSERSLRDYPRAQEQLPHLSELGSCPAVLPLLPLTRPKPVGDPAGVVLERAEIRVDPVSILVRHEYQETTPGLPDDIEIPAELVQERQYRQDLAAAIEQLEDGTHPSLEAARREVERMQAQAERLRQDLVENTPDLEERLTGKTVSRLEDDPTRSLSALLQGVPPAAEQELIPFVFRVRNCVLAEQETRRAEAKFAEGQEQEVRRLQEELGQCVEKDMAAQRAFLAAALRPFLAERSALERFPEEDYFWQLEPVLAPRFDLLSLQERVAFAEQKWAADRAEAEERKEQKARRGREQKEQKVRRGRERKEREVQRLEQAERDRARGRSMAVGMPLLALSLLFAFRVFPFPDEFAVSTAVFAWFAWLRMGREDGYEAGAALSWLALVVLCGTYLGRGISSLIAWFRAFWPGGHL